MTSPITLLALGLQLRSPLEKCETLKIEAPVGGYAAGVPYQVGDTIAVSYGNYDEGDNAVLIFKAPKIALPGTNGESPDVGDAIYYDTVNENVLTTTSDSNIRAGVLLKDEGSDVWQIALDGAASGVVGPQGEPGTPG